MLDLFAGRLGWTKAFLARGWECVAVDLVEPENLAEMPRKLEFLQYDVLGISHWWIQQRDFDFICGSSPCEEFSCFGMKHFQPNPPYPEMGCRLFWHAHKICKLSGVPFILENVRSAQQFVGKADAHCGPFYLWGDSIPPLLPQGITKAKWRPNSEHGRNAPGNFAPELNLPKAERKAKLATIPPELAHCVAEYAERLLEAEARSRGTQLGS